MPWKGLESEELVNRSVSWLVGIPVVADGILHGAEKFVVTYNIYAHKSTDLQTHKYAQYAGTHAHTHTQTQAHTRADTLTCTPHTRIGTHTHSPTHTHMHTHPYPHILTNMHTCRYTPITSHHTHTHTCTQMYTGNTLTKDASWQPA